MQLLVVGRDVAKPDIASEEDLQVPVLVEGDQVADVSVAHVGLLRQHSRHKHVVNSEDSFVAVLERLLLKEKLMRNLTTILYCLSMSIVKNTEMNGHLQ